eukprot:m.245791 g.245791  ORF g.245791 m.245791 type:complete len:72 (-) comp33840_c4_seq1:129-344(-)
MWVIISLHVVGLSLRHENHNDIFLQNTKKKEPEKNKKTKKKKARVKTNGYTTKTQQPTVSEKLCTKLYVCQ